MKSKGFSFGLQIITTLTDTNKQEHKEVVRTTSFSFINNQKERR